MSVKPHVSAEEWKALRLTRERDLKEEPPPGGWKDYRDTPYVPAWFSVGEGGRQLMFEGDPMAVYPRDLPAVAAFCLHERPEGFTWDDVDALLSAAGNLKALGARPLAARVGDLASRIAALMPPRGET